jgi:hypothetical protein
VKALESPIQNGSVARRWYHIFLLDPNRWRPYRRELRNQIEARGAIPNDVWQTGARRAVARRIEELICEHCWGEAYAFHPNDPWFVIGEIEVGDLSEVELIMAIEEEYGIDLSEQRFPPAFTFGDMVDLAISSARSVVVHPTGAKSKGQQSAAAHKGQS